MQTGRIHKYKTTIRCMKKSIVAIIKVWTDHKSSKKTKDTSMLLRITKTTKPTWMAWTRVVALFILIACGKSLKKNDYNVKSYLKRASLTCSTSTFGVLGKAMLTFLVIRARYLRLNKQLHQTAIQSISLTKSWSMYSRQEEVLT